MGAATDKLNADWETKKALEAEFAIRAILEELYNAASDAITSGAEYYPTSDPQLNALLQPIVQEVSDFKTFLDQYAEVLQWRQP